MSKVAQTSLKMNSTAKPFITATDDDHLRAIKRRLKTRPSTAIEKRSQSSAAFIRYKAEYGKPSIGTFGSDAPMFTISSSRRNKVSRFQTPGPGAYNPPIEPQENLKIKRRIPIAQRDVDKGSLTMNIDFIDKAIFPNKEIGKTIGTKSGGTFYMINDSPGPSYVPKSTLSTRGHKITSRTGKRNDNDNPGPGKYSPTNPAMPKAPSYTCQGPKDRSKWLVTENNPSPSEYSPKMNNVLRKQPQWTIGEKSRRTKTRQNPNPPKSRFIAIDYFVIPLGLDADIEADKKYIDEHPAIREMIRDVMEIIMEFKPDDPLDYMRQYFSRFKKPPKQPKESYDDF